LRFGFGFSITCPIQTTVSQRSLHFSDVSGGRFNNFDFLRLFLATLVIFAHSFVIPYGDKHDATEPLHYYTDGQINGGALAVSGFFAISGFLILISFQNSRSMGSYFKKRCARIYPGYIVAFLFCVLVVAPLSGVSWSTILAPKTLATNLVLPLVFGKPRVEGAFADMPWTVLNGSLWTIRYEFLCYIMVAALGVLGLLKKPKLVLALFLAALVMHLLQGRYQIREDESAIKVPGLAASGPWWRFMTYFAAGMVLAVYQQKIPYRLSIAFACAVALAVSTWLGVLWMLLPICGVYILFFFAFYRPLPLQRTAKFGDFSYGVYLYAWPVQQLVFMYSGKTIGPWGLFLIATAVTFVLAILSWHLLEKHFLRKAHPTKDRPSEQVESVPPPDNPKVMQKPVDEAA
jgi:peptidoglycan/LPS O-acetylase OafA/YrhL